MPISFMGGTGGNFVRSLLISAKVGYTNLWDISSNGNSHWGPMEVYNDTFNRIPNDLSCSVEHVLDAIKHSTLTYDEGDCFYQNMHILQLDSIMQHFAKSIRVIYDFDDITDVSVAMVAKNSGDGNLNANDFQYMKKNFVVRKMVMIRHLKDFQRADDFNGRVLYVSWKDICYKDAKEFFSGLSQFTGIPLENFSLDNLTRWRSKTLGTIEDLKKKYSYDFR